MRNLLRYPAGVKARQLTAMRRAVLSRIFDRQLRKTF